MTYGEAYRYGRESLLEAGVPEAELDARLLLEYVCKTCRNDLLAHGDREINGSERTAYEELIAGRKGRTPLQYLTGEQDFMGLTFSVNEDVLIPRQDTEILVEEVLRHIHDGMRLLDMCTGSGCILISLLHYTNDCEGVGAEVSEAALKVAEQNAGKLLEHRVRSGGISFVQSDLFEKIQGKFDVIVCNPPYIPGGTIPGLMPEVRDHEPMGALDGGEDGLSFYRRIVEEGRPHLTGGGMLFFEIGYEQAQAVAGLMEKAGFSQIHVVKDYAGLDRVVYGTRDFGLCAVKTAE